MALRWLPFAAALGGCALGAAPAAAAYAPHVGEKHPDFVLPSVADGKPVALSQFRGHKVLVIHLSSW